MIQKSFDCALRDSLRDLASELGVASSKPFTSLSEQQRNSLSGEIEQRFVEATWTLRRLPDKEAGYLYSTQILWPEMQTEARDGLQLDVCPLSTVLARKKLRIDPVHVDRMQPTLDLLRLLPDLDDRRILFWGAWHQDGEVQDRIPWAKVRRSLQSGLSRWTLKRRYANAMDWIAANAVSVR